MNKTETVADVLAKKIADVQPFAESHNDGIRIYQLFAKPENGVEYIATILREAARLERALTPIPVESLGRESPVAEQVEALRAVVDGAVEYRRPAAWIKGHKMHTDYGIEHDVEVVAGEDVPDSRGGWVALYTAPLATPPASAPDHIPLNAVRAALEAVDTGRTQIARDNLRILEIHLRAQISPASGTPVATENMGVRLSAYLRDNHAVFLWPSSCVAALTAALQQEGKSHGS